ncbi:MAG: hypothetical protein NT015_14640 [Alphaproteobacteria bacterium]|nr:hypothetical protein [Alphaproteobacteria bacterium]
MQIPKQVAWILAALVLLWLAFVRALEHFIYSLPEQPDVASARVELVRRGEMQFFATAWEADLIKWGPAVVWLVFSLIAIAAHYLIKVRKPTNA